MDNKNWLKTSWQHARRTPGMGRNVTAVAVVMALGMSALAWIFTNQGNPLPWADRFEFSADFVQAAAVDVDERPRVRIAGVEVGRITGSEITPKGHARLTFSIDPDVPIHEDVQAVLRPRNPLNEMYVELSPGTGDRGRLPEHTIVPVQRTQSPVQIDEVLQDLDGRARRAASALMAMSDAALANAPARLPKGLTATAGAARDMTPVLEKLDTRRDKIRQLVTAMSDIMTAVGRNDGRLTSLANSVETALGTMARRNDNLRQALGQLPETVDELDGSMTALDSLTKELNPTLDNLTEASTRLPRTLDRLTSVLREADRTVKAAQPVVAGARPVVADLRPISRDARSALGDLAPMTARLDQVTSILVPYLDDLWAFTYNSSSMFSVSDANGGLVRGHLTIPLPDGGVIPGAHGGNTFPNSQGRQEDN